MSDVAQRIAALSPERRALLAKRLAAAGEAPRRLGDAPVGIVGLACRFPGAPNEHAFWRLLAEGRDGVTEVPADRWQASALYHPDPSVPGRMTTRWGGFLEGLGRFDPAFFDLAPREAARMDPQHRLLLEVAFRALEDAGLPLLAIRASKTGVFVALCQSDYARIAAADRDRIDAYSGFGSQRALAANRLSYWLDARGPSLIVDTACSSSLVAIHLACRSLLARECDRAIVAASNLILAPEDTIAMSKWGMMAADGRCKTFDARADGFVRGEGCGALVLERLADGLARGSAPRAVIRGTAVNQDGRSNGLTAPNPAAQSALITQALADAGVAASHISYLEAHGTGTALGDPIEVQALTDAFQGAGPEAGCVIGAVKTNVGHLEAAAGLAGVIKTVLSLEHEEIPPNLHFESQNPRFSLAGTPFELATMRVPWPRGAKPRIAGVSSFGMGGTNGHVIIEEAPTPAERPVLEDRSEIVFLSARTLEALVEITRDLRSLAPNKRLCELAAALALHRTHFEHRLAIVARDPAELSQRLDAVSSQKPSDGIHQGRATPTGASGLVFVFAGTGSEQPGMGRQLFSSEPTFRHAVERADDALRAAGGSSVLAAFTSASHSAEPIPPSLVQPLIFAVQIGLAVWLRTFGAEPDAVVGHSLGEIAAAHVAGALSLEDAAGVVVHRSRLLQAKHGTGAMVLLELALDATEAALMEEASDVSIAAQNAPRQTVVTGAPRAISQFVNRLGQAGVFGRRLASDIPFHHAPAMAPLARELALSLSHLTPRATTIPFFSTVTGDLLEGGRVDAVHWARNLEARVRFWPAIERLASQGYRTFVELGGHPRLLPAIREGLDHTRIMASLLPTLRGDEPERGRLLDVLAALQVVGAPIDLSRLFPHGAPRSSLPGYPLRHDALPIDLQSSSPSPMRAHPLLGPPIEISSLPGARVFQSTIEGHELVYLRDHRIQGTAVLPGTALLEMVLAAGQMVFGERARTVRDVAFEKPVFLGDGLLPELELTLRGGLADRVAFEINGRASRSAPFQSHARGQLLIAPEIAPRPPPLDLASIAARCDAQLDGPSFYARLAVAGNGWGPAFQGIEAVRFRPGEALVALLAPPVITASLGRYRLHPALLDAAGQALATAVGSDDPRRRSPLVIAGLGEFEVFASLPARARSHIVLAEDRRKDSLEATVTITAEGGEVIARMSGLRLQFLNETRAGSPSRGPLFSTEWREATLPPAGGPKPAGLILVGEDHALASDLRALAEGAAIPCERVPDPRTSEVLWPAGHALVVLATRPEDATGSAPDEAMALAQRYLDTALAAARRLPRAAHPARLWLITRGAQTIAGSPASPAGATLWGLGRTLGAELPASFAGLIDLAPVPRPDEPRALLEALINAPSPFEAALREGRALVPRLTSISLAAEVAPRFSRGAVLISGGLGGLGLSIARRLVERGTKSLVLLGRRGAPAGSAARAHVTELESLGATIEVAALDVADEAGLRSLLARREREGRPPLSGVLHAAGVLSRAPFAEIDASSLGESLSTKLAGALSLDRACGDVLDFFVLFGSASALVPSPLLGAYAAANASLSAVAQSRRARGARALAVSWGFWSGAGMAKDAALPRGAAAFSPAEGLDVLERLLGSSTALDLVEVAALPGDAAALVASQPVLAGYPLLEELASRAPRTSITPAEVAIPRPGEVSRPRSERRVELVAYLRARVAATVKLAPERLGDDQPITSLGVDSLMAVELKNRLEADLQLSVPIVRLLEAAGIGALADRLLEDAAPGEENDWEVLTL